MIQINLHEVKISTSERNGKVAFWLGLGPGDKWNVIDVPPNRVPIGYLPDLIRRAFELGVCAQKQLMQQHLLADTFKVTEEDSDERH